MFLERGHNKGKEGLRIKFSLNFQTDLILNNYFDVAIEKTKTIGIGDNFETATRANFQKNFTNMNLEERSLPKSMSNMILSRMQRTKLMPTKKQKLNIMTRKSFLKVKK